METVYNIDRMKFLRNCYWTEKKKKNRSLPFPPGKEDSSQHASSILREKT